MAEEPTLVELHEAAQRILLEAIPKATSADAAERLAHAYSLLHGARPKPSTDRVARVL